MIPGGGNIAAAEVGEEVEVLGGRAVRCCATKAAPPAIRMPEAAGTEEKS